ncbi:MAG TPA: ATP phosphoribosyltransferase regulatory subunit, partial [Dehalococcoidia bacterium]|nr:ATP phosphoribosyltransferase regulatory subunit [Dehalococcoidia bacterium]
RRFEYYSGLVFRFERDGRRLGGGGRYDHLIELVHGRPVPASGFAFELEPLMALVTPSTGRPTGPAVLVEPAGSDASSIAAALRAADGLRERGCIAWLTADSSRTPTWRLAVEADGYALSPWSGGVPRRCASLDDVASALGGLG